MADFAAELAEHNASVIVYGASDDLIELDGGIYEEFNPPYDMGEDDPIHITFSNGVILRVRYDNDGIWRFTPISDYHLVKVIPADMSRYEESNQNTDKVFILGETPAWAALSSNIAPKRKI